jgi:hypothetical protein
MRILAAAVLALLLAGSAYAEPQFPDASETDEELIELWEDSNETCRGGSGNDVKTWAACAARSVYATATNERDWCYGKEGQASAELEWHRCEENSLRFTPVDKYAL